MEVDVKSKECPICQYEFAETNTAFKVIAVLLILLMLYYVIF